MIRKTKRVKRIKTLHNDGYSSEHTDESYYEYPKAVDSAEGNKKSVSGIASALTDKEYMKVVSTLGIVEK